MAINLSVFCLPQPFQSVFFNQSNLFYSFLLRKYFFFLLFHNLFQNCIRLRMSLISILFITLVFLIQFSFASHSNVYAVSLAQINLQLPNLYINFGPRPYYWLRFLNGTLQSKNGPFHSAIINRRFINGDFNNDGYADAAVLVKLNYNSSGYFNTFVVAVIQDYNGGPQVPIPVIVGSIAIEDIKTFTWD